ncbi:armadillo-type protein [Syncephalastrum racemosum]|uniref:Armadillo-type protein n=1 Tax=Syncephalastrum racemosum TaxID=13706 RepID=A0A1X2HGV1_SYNRA|nr:armadillo-type protein [Syncephalastrum racemosum]
MAHWQPQQQGLQDLLILLRDAVRPECRDQALVQQQLASFNKIPDYNSYLVYILTQMPNEESYTRAIAGLTLKNNIRSFFNSMPLPVLDYVKACCAHALDAPDPDLNVRKSIGSVITAIVTRGQAHNWPDILQRLVHKLDDPNPIVVEMAFDALGKICEDAARDLDQEMDGIRPLNFMIPKFIEFFYNPDPRLRMQAIAATSQFVLLRSQSLMVNMQPYLQGLFARAGDENPGVRQEICRSLVMVLEARPDKLEPDLPAVIDYMIYSTQDENEQVALEACDFWIQFASVEEFADRLVPYLGKIVPALLRRMVYSDMDLLGLGGDEDDAHVPDNEHEIKPRFYRSKPRAATTHATSDAKDGEQEDGNAPPAEDTLEDDDEEEEEDDDDGDLDDDEFYSEWTLRKCSAAALDVLSTTYTGHIVTHLLPLLNHNLFSQDWKERESGVLALGAAAEGALDDIAPHLSEMLPYLLQSLNDTKPLIRSITCWALGRFSRWCVKQAATPQGRTAFFEPVLFSLLQRILDKNKRVQEAACSAFATLEEEATFELIPYLEPILINLTTAFGTYQHKNLLILYDALGTLAESVGQALNQPQCLSLMMPPLIAKWNGLSDHDTDLFPLLECLSSVTAALGTGFTPYAEPVFMRCVKLVSATLHQIFLADQSPEEHDPPEIEFMVVALDLLSGLVQGMGQLVEPLVATSDPPLLSLLAVCIHDPVTEVLQATYALIGDLAIACFERLRSYLPTIIPELIEQISPDLQTVSVSNNAIWAAGEIAIRWGGEIQPYVEPLLQRLFPLLLDGHPVADSLQENALITIGRLGMACPSLLATRLPSFIKVWLAKSANLRENEEKDSAFQGLCQVIKINPEGVADQLNTLLVSIAQWQLPSPQLSALFAELFSGYKNLLTAEQWPKVWTALPPDAQQALTERYDM